MVADWEFLNAQWTDGMCAKLHIVQIINVATHRWFPISFMKLILSKASLLRTLSVNECPGSQDDPLNDLLTCRRASVQAEVLFKVKKTLFWVANLSYMFWVSTSLSLYALLSIFLLSTPLRPLELVISWGGYFLSSPQKHFKLQT